MSPPQSRTQPGAPSKLWTIAELADWLNVSIDAAWETVRARKIPYLFYGKGTPNLDRKGSRSVRFLPSAVMRWAEANQAYWGDPVEVDESPLPEAVAPAAAGEGNWRDELGGAPKRRRPNR